MKKPVSPVTAGVIDLYAVDANGDVFEVADGDYEYIAPNPRGLYADIADIALDPLQRDLITDTPHAGLRRINYLMSGYPDTSAHEAFWIATAIADAALEGKPIEEILKIRGGRCKGCKGTKTSVRFVPHAKEEAQSS